MIKPPKPWSRDNTKSPKPSAKTASVCRQAELQNALVGIHAARETVSTMVGILSMVFPDNSPVVRGETADKVIKVALSNLEVIDKLTGKLL